MAKDTSRSLIYVAKDTSRSLIYVAKDTSRSLIYVAKDTSSSLINTDYFQITVFKSFCISLTVHIILYSYTFAY